MPPIKTDHGCQTDGNEYRVTWVERRETHSGPYFARVAKTTSMVSARRFMEANRVSCAVVKPDEWTGEFAVLSPVTVRKRR